MKQNLPPAKAAVLIAIFVPALSLCLSACATLPRHASSNAQIILSRPAAQPLNINVATANDFEKLPGVGKVIAERIISYRTENGPFRRAEHLMMVRGISEEKFREMRSLIAAK